jgi:hypothetical protein
MWNVIVNTQKNNTHSHQINTQEFEDTKGVIRTINWRRTDNTMSKRKRTKGHTTIYKTLHRKLKTQQHEPFYKPKVNSGAL